MAFGRFDRSAGAEPMSDINMTPLIDVMLVLLVIFIITAPLLVGAVRLDLPTTNAAQASTPASASVSIVVDRSGQVYLHDAALTLEALQQQLQSIGQTNSATEVQLRADKNVSYGRIVEVMGAAQKAGLSRIGFVAEPALSP